MSRLEELPDLPEPAPFLLVALALAFWLSMRIRILRRMQARRGPEGEAVPAWGWMRTLAAQTWIQPALAVAAVLLAAATAATFLLQ